MKIRMKSIMAGPDGVHNVGDMVDFPEAKAMELIKQGYAELPKSGNRRTRHRETIGYEATYWGGTDNPKELFTSKQMKQLSQLLNNSEDILNRIAQIASEFIARLDNENGPPRQPGHSDIRKTLEELKKQSIIVKQLLSNDKLTKQIKELRNSLVNLDDFSEQRLHSTYWRKIDEDLTEAIIQNEYVPTEAEQQQLKNIQKAVFKPLLNSFDTIAKSQFWLERLEQSIDWTLEEHNSQPESQGGRSRNSAAKEMAVTIFNLLKSYDIKVASLPSQDRQDMGQSSRPSPFEPIIQIILDTANDNSSARDLALECINPERPDRKRKQKSRTS